jgi:hypothetical protein
MYYKSFFVKPDEGEVRSMKIQGLPLGNNGINSIVGNPVQKVSLENSIKKTDSVEISKTASVKDSFDTLLSMVEPDYNPRSEVVESATNNISNEVYDGSGVLTSVAEKLIDNNIAADIIDNLSVNTARGDKVEEAISNILYHFYYNPDIMKEIADRIIRDGGLNSFFEKIK